MVARVRIAREALDVAHVVCLKCKDHNGKDHNGEGLWSQAFAM